MDIHLICNNDSVEARLRHHFGEGYNLISLTKEKSSLPYQVVIIVEPYIIKKQYLSISSIWKNYLLEHYPEAKLIVAGFNHRDTHPNYLSLLHLHEGFDLGEYITRAPVISEGWDITHLQNSYGQVMTKLRQFFTGHNNESIIDAVSKVRQLLNNAELSLHGSASLNRTKEDFRTIWEERLYPKRNFFQHFYSRWHYYRDYFYSLPFYHLLADAGVEEFIQQLSEIFRNSRQLDDDRIQKLELRYRKVDPFTRIGIMTQLFRRINNKYIAAESAGTILLIDHDPSFYELLREQLYNFRFDHIQDQDELPLLTGQESVNLILLDLELEKGEKNFSGLDWIGRLKALYPDVPLAVVTIHNRDFQALARHSVEHEGANHFLDKGKFDADKWRNVFIGLINKTRYTLGDIIIFNQSRDWQTKSSILVIEDEQEWYDRYAELSAEYHFVRANTVQQGKELLGKHHFDLVLLDLLFKQNAKLEPLGYEFVDYWKSEYRHIPIIVITRDKRVPTEIDLNKRGVETILFKEDFHAEKWLGIIHDEIEYKKIQERRKSR